MKGAVAPDGKPKMVWAHFVTWPIDFIKKYDDPQNNWPRYLDRTLLGKWVNTREGMEAFCGVQIDTARKYGIDGFAVDVPQSRHYISSMERLYRSAEGTDFKLALCVDGWNHNGQTPGQVAEDLIAYFKRFGRHPNNQYIQGKPVVFIYQTNRPVSISREIIQKVKAAGYEAYWIVQPQRETSGLWEPAGMLEENLQVFDGLYDFGINGVPLSSMKQRLQNGRSALDKSGRGGILVAGITLGYAGVHNGYYRPFHGTGTMRDNWQAAMEVNADWVCLTTWNDYTESTQFEPTEWGHDSRLALNAECIRKWRGQPPLERSADAIFSYKSNVRLGDQWTMEVLGFPYTTSQAFCHVRLQAPDGKVIRKYSPVRLLPHQRTIETLRSEAPGFDQIPVFTPWVAMTDSPEEPSPGEWKCLYPVTIYAGTMRDLKTVQIRMGQLLAMPRNEIVTTPDACKIIARVPEINPCIGSVELIRNGIVEQRREIPAEGPVKNEAEFTIPMPPDGERAVLYFIRFNRADGRFALSPVFQPQKARPVETVNVPVLVRDGDFDETWGTRFITATEVKRVAIAKSQLYGFRFPMDDAHAGAPRDTGGWGIVALGGGVFWDRVDTQAVPIAAEESVADQKALRFFRFDGVKSRIVLQPGALPFDVLTVELRFRAKTIAGESYLFSDANQGIAIGLNSEGKLFAERAELRVISSQAVEPNVWNHAAAVYDGKSLTLYWNRTPAGSAPVAPTVRPINSIVAFGCRIREGSRYSAYFAGDMAGVSVMSRPLSADEFNLPAIERNRP